MRSILLIAAHPLVIPPNDIRNRGNSRDKGWKEEGKKCIRRAVERRLQRPISVFAELSGMFIQFLKLSQFTNSRQTFIKGARCPSSVSFSFHFPVRDNEASQDCRRRIQNSLSNPRTSTDRLERRAWDRGLGCNADEITRDPDQPTRAV